MTLHCISFSKAAFHSLMCSDIISAKDQGRGRGGGLIKLCQTKKSVIHSEKGNSVLWCTSGRFTRSSGRPRAHNSTSIYYTKTRASSKDPQIEGITKITPRSSNPGLTNCRLHRESIYRCSGNSPDIISQALTICRMAHFAPPLAYPFVFKIFVLQLLLKKKKKRSLRGYLMK